MVRLALLGKKRREQAPTGTAARRELDRIGMASRGAGVLGKLVPIAVILILVASLLSLVVFLRSCTYGTEKALEKKLGCNDSICPPLLVPRLPAPPSEAAPT